jgi:hypothetical protein
MLAGLPMLAFAGADYLFAPPSDKTGSDPLIRQAVVGAHPKTAEAARSVARPPVHGRSGEMNGALVHVANHAEAKPPAEDPYSSLVASIQRELTRVGCYAGEADGSWTNHTKVAMRAFNDSVHVSLGTDQPDYILLTLLQGHSGKACARACSGGMNPSAQCIDKTIEARRVPPARLDTRQAAAGSTAQATTSSAKIPLPVKAPVPVAPTWSTATARYPAAVPPAYEAPRYRETVATPAEPLPGRMSVGAQPSSEPEPRESVASAAADSPQPEHAPMMATSRPAPVARPSAPVSNSKSRLSRTFIELSRNSP